jgi:hypothetical protein
MRGLLAVVPLLFLNQPERPPVEYQGTDPITISVTFASREWVNEECTKKLRRQPSPGMVFVACAGIRAKWAYLPHGCLFADAYAGLVCHEVGHPRGWDHP